MFSLRIKYAIQILSELRRYNERGVRPTAFNLRERCGFPRGGEQLQVMAQLRKGGWLCYENHYYSIAVDLSEKTLYDLMVSMNEELRIGPSPTVDWPVKSRSLCDSAIVLERELRAAFEQQLKASSIAVLTRAAQPDTSKTNPVLTKESHVKQKKAVLINGIMNLNERNN